MSGNERAYRRVPGARIPGLIGPEFPDGVDELAAVMTQCGQTVSLMLESLRQLDGYQRVLDREVAGIAWALIFFGVQEGAVVLALPVVVGQVISPSVYLQGKATPFEARAIVQRAINMIQRLGR